MDDEYTEISSADFFDILKKHVNIQGNMAHLIKGGKIDEYGTIFRRCVRDRDGNLWGMKARWSPLACDFSVEANIAGRVIVG